MAEDIIEVSILEDGQIRSVTDPISAPNHASADKLFKLLRDLTGGSEERTRRSQKHVHHHEVGHTHDHQKAGH